MAGDEALYRVADGGALLICSQGLVIVRRIKHEPIPLDWLNRDVLRRRTDAREGSKFLADWPLPRLARWIREQVEANGWIEGQCYEATVRFDKPVGISAGRNVYCIRIVCPDGRYVHAYPVADESR